MKYSPDRNHLVVTSKNNPIRIYSSNTYDFVQELNHFLTQPQSIFFTDKYLTIINNGQIDFLSNDTFKNLKTIQVKPKLNKLEFAPDFRYLMAFDINENTNITIISTQDF